jgi:hypothetical protein
MMPGARWARALMIVVTIIVIIGLVLSGISWGA